jgi:D-psicose/D-tagatose/L-ribulose 3-epimerase
MKFGINAFLWTGHFGSADFALLPQIRQHGFDGVEVALFRPSQLEASAIRKAVEANKLECTVCGVFPKEFSLVDSDPAVRQRTRSHLSDCIKATAEAGAHVIAGPLYAPVGYLPGRRRTADEWQWVVETYQELGPVLARHDVSVGIEPLNRFETYFLNTTADGVALCEQIGDPRVGLLWDTFHANIEEKSLGNTVRMAGPHLKHVHTCENDRGIPGTGHVDWAGVFRALREVQYDGWLTIESFGFTIGELSAAASIWRDLAVSPEEIAWEGVKFLKRAWNGVTSQAGKTKYPQ